MITMMNVNHLKTKVHDEEKTSCIICEKIKEKKARIIYEDDYAIAVLPSRPAVAGHIKVIPKNHFTKIDEMSDSAFEQLMLLASYASASVFDTFKAHGSNILLNEGSEHLAVDILPRKEGDGLKFMWQPKQALPEQLDDALAKLKDKAFVVGKAEKKTPVVEQMQKIEPALTKNEPRAEPEEMPHPHKKQEPVNYLVKQLHKIP